MDVKKQEKNIAVLLFLSDYKAGSKEADYRYVNGEIYKGKQTNDAPVECLLKMALAKSAGLEDLKSGSKLKLGQDKKLYILCITSYKVMTGEGKTAWVNFQDTVKTLQEKYIEKDEECKLNPIEVISIPYDYRGEGDNYTQFSEEEEDTNRMAQRIFGDISAKLTENGISDVYVDYTGGMRDISFLMTTIVRYLEFEGINCQKIVYSQYSRDNSDYNRIRDITYIYEMFQMINGVNEFVTTGRANALNDIFKAERDKAEDKGKKGDYEEVKNLLENMVAFSNAMSICDVSKIDDYLDEISKSIDRLMPSSDIGGTSSNDNDSEDNNLGDKEKSDNQDLKIAMLKQLLDLMKKKMYLNDLGKKDYDLKLIKWCVENNMLQQALTLVEDKMPGVYFGIGLLTYEFRDKTQRENFTSLDVVPRYEDRDENNIFYHITRFDSPQLKESRSDIRTKYNGKRDKDKRQCNNPKGIESVLEQLSDDLIRLSRECQEENKGQEDKFIDSYCAFRRLQAISEDKDKQAKPEDKGKKTFEEFKESDFPRSGYFSILNWCSGEQGHYHTYSGYKGNRIELSLKMHRQIKYNQGKRDHLEQAFLLHSALKTERNCCNHASAKGIRLPADVVKRAIEVYVKRVEEILGFIGS